VTDMGRLQVCVPERNARILEKAILRRAELTASAAALRSVNRHGPEGQDSTPWEFLSISVLFHPSNIVVHPVLQEIPAICANLAVFIK
jgi:hypothetical protein